MFYSAYIPVVENPLLPAKTTEPPLLREHRLYQADWLLRFYGFDANELLDEKHPFLNPYVDPKCNWALNHMELFPLEINRRNKGRTAENTRRRRAQCSKNFWRLGVFRR